jgi:hypothetical protein
MTPKKDKLEVSSDQLRAELIEIKERVGALETIASISNRVEVEKYIRLHLTNIQRRTPNPPISETEVQLQQSSSSRCSSQAIA